MIDVPAVLRAVPRFDTFCSVDQLRALVEELRTDAGFSVGEVGTSEQGRPIHHVRFGTGRLKAMLVGFPHPNEPIGGLTVFSLLTLLRQRADGLASADVEWHVIPCIDPDGAILNEGWSQQPFSLVNYMRNFHRQAARDQVDCSFPLSYKRLQFDQPIKETRVLMQVLERVRPDFYYSLHNNAGASGAWLLLTHALPEKYYRELHVLLEQHDIPLQVSAPLGGQLTRFADGIYECPVTTKLYDNLERTTPTPEEFLPRGAMSFEYLQELNRDAVSFISELPYVRHPAAGSKQETTQNLRQLKLRVDAENKFMAAAILEEWHKVETDLNTSSAFYRKMVATTVSAKDKLLEGLPSWPAKTRDLLFNPRYGRNATEGERFDVYLLDRFFVLCHCYEFLRLLLASAQTEIVQQAASRLDRLFEDALHDLRAAVDFDGFKAIDYSTLAKLQLGSGLIVLNAVAERLSAATGSSAGSTRATHVRAAGS